MDGLWKEDGERGKEGRRKETVQLDFFDFLVLPGACDNSNVIMYVQKLIPITLPIYLCLINNLKYFKFIFMVPKESYYSLGNLFTKNLTLNSRIFILEMFRYQLTDNTEGRSRKKKKKKSLTVHCSV